MNAYKEDEKCVMHVDVHPTVVEHIVSEAHEL